MLVLSDFTPGSEIIFFPIFGETFVKNFPPTSSLFLNFFIFFFFFVSEVKAQEQEIKTSEEKMHLTIFLKHDQSKTLQEIREQLTKTEFWKKFPPDGTEVVSWYVMMGIGQVVTLRFPPEKLRTVNLAIEESAWNAFRTEFYPTYDFQPVWANNMGKEKAAKQQLQQENTPKLKIQILDAPLLLGEVRQLPISPYFNIDYNTKLLSIQKIITPEGAHLLNIRGQSKGNAQVLVTDFARNQILYTIQVIEESPNYIEEEVRKKHFDKEEEEKIQLATAWMEEGREFFAKRDQEASAHYQAFECFTKAKFLLASSQNSPAELYEEAKKRVNTQLDTMEYIFQVSSREFEKSLTLKKIERCQQLIEYLDQFFPDERLVNPKSNNSYKACVRWMEKRLQAFKSF